MDEAADRKGIELRRIRKRMIQKRATLGLAERAAHSHKICQYISEWAAFRNAHRVAFYAALKGEVDLWPLLKIPNSQNKTFYLPRVSNKQLQFCQYDSEARLVRGNFGVMEPSPEDEAAKKGEIDLFLVPGVAFDWMGNRLGYGKGYYDQGLGDYQGSALTLGIAYGFQMHGSIVQKPWDVPVGTIVTEGGIKPIRRFD